MSRKLKSLIVAGLAAALTFSVIFAGCTGAPSPQTPVVTSTPSATSPAPTPTTQPAAWKWPNAIHVLGMGSSGQVKLVSVTSMLEAKTGMLVRVQSEDSYVMATRGVKENKFAFADFSASAVANAVMGLDEYAVRDGGPFIPMLVYSSSYGSTGFVVRGDSPIKTPRDIKPGMKMGISRKTTGMMNPYLALLNWAGLKEDDVLWVETGDTTSAVRAVVDGRADLAFAPPSGPYIYEAVAGPKSARYIDMNPEKDTEGAKAFTAIGPLYGLGPAENAPPSIRGTWVMSSYRWLFTSSKADTELIYHIAKWFDDNYNLFKDAHETNRWMTLDSIKEGLKTIYFPVHPGLKKFLIEKGVWTDAHEKRSQYNYDLCESYVKAYDEAIAKADAQKITVSPTNQKWLELWENYKAEKKIPLLRVHPSLTENAPVIPSPGYKVPVPEPSPTPAAPAPEPGVTGDVAFKFVSVTDPVSPGGDVVVVAKTVPGAKCKLTMMYSSGVISSIVFTKPEQVADADGNVAWKGALDPVRVTRGKTTLTVNITAPDGKTGKAVTYFEIK
ncbi:MAG: TAXI family TRAP transporter solute-binding subunit [Chloroflexota bacterium]